MCRVPIWLYQWASSTPHSEQVAPEKNVEDVVGVSVDATFGPHEQVLGLFGGLFALELAEAKEQEPGQIDGAGCTRPVDCHSVFIGLRPRHFTTESSSSVLRGEVSGGERY